ncbi:HVO_2922 family protein [Halostella salina]|uniref:HVO_2922 family protein n=1 Tax=Halostella salina TaxID=1547897 RepID=UPI001969B536|nr:HVO_2922 family protein [Halostella salina]
MGENTVSVSATLEVEVDENELELASAGDGTVTTDLSAPGVDGVLRVDAETVAAAVEDAVGSDERESPPDVDRAVEGVDLAERAEGTADAQTDREPADALPADPFADEQPTVEESKARFELYRDRAGDWRWRLRHDNGNVIADGGQGYSSRRNAEQGLRSVQANAPGGEVELVPE